MNNIEIMIIKELKKIIKDLPDDMEVGGIGHFNELLVVLGTKVTKVDKDYPFHGENKNSEIDIFCIDLQCKGPDPD